MSKQTKDAKHFDVDVKVRDFCSKSKLFFIIGFALILISLLSTFTGVDVALEFKGGTIITYSYTGDVDESSISKELTSLVGSTVKVQQGDSLDSDTKTLSLSFTSTEGLTIDRQNEVTNKVKELCPDNEVELLDANDVNARSGGEFFAKCIVAAVFAALILIVYIALRFKQISGWSAGVCAVLGLPLSGTPLGAALERREAAGCRRAGWRPDYVLARPEDFDGTGFIVPDELMHASFRPWRLFKSCLRRLWLARRK